MYYPRTAKIMQKRSSGIRMFFPILLKKNRMGGIHAKRGIEQ